MPVRRADDDDRAFAGHRLSALAHLLGLPHRLLLDGLAFAVQPVELGRDAGRLARVGGRQQPRAKAGVADAAAGIDAGTEEEAEMVRFAGLLQPGRIHERREADPPALAHHLQALAHERRG